MLLLNFKAKDKSVQTPKKEKRDFVVYLYVKKQKEIKAKHIHYYIECLPSRDKW